MDVESDILKAIGHRDGMDYDDADNLMSLLEEANDDLDLEGEEGSAVDEVVEPRMIEPVDPVPTTFAPVGVNRVKPSYNSQDPIESIEEIKSMQEVKSIEPIKSIEEIESIQEIKSIEEVPDQVAKEFIAVSILGIINHLKYFLKIFLGSHEQREGASQGSSSSKIQQQ